MEAMPPGMPVVPHAEIQHHHQDLNKKILISLMAASCVLGAILMFISCFWIFKLRKSKKCLSKADDIAKLPLSNVGSERKFSSSKNGEKSLVTAMEFQLLETATNNFNDKYVISEGDHGKLYKACFSDKRQATVKRLEKSKEMDAEFENEITWLTKIRHQNIISLVGCTIDSETRCIVYEIMHNGTLENQLHAPSRGSPLTWNMRIQIAVDVAKGLEFLHEHCSPPIVHRNLKSTNILLDANFHAKLSDFGLAATYGAHNKKTKLPDTSCPELTDKNDVYAYGVVLLELLTGRRSDEIVTWAMPNLSDRSKLSTIVDPEIMGTMEMKHLYQVAAVAVLCVQHEASYRPLITDVLHSLIPLVLEPKTFNEL